ncbi:MAG: hypothetical protein AVDCRST_MAG14-1041 [uncultured Rubrobacteraceae bacterium]|uniref:Uncharacterized protein n=1 Tax=uncultured Rubrobacteraceae bacterium TaxID=349277 RepID=A0A6J4QQH0_9ACTN|nr:MAG: hypothetical protein AVDCRST_MAG14-1041 [uncultured Rubrobacteraceae bacterium]
MLLTSKKTSSKSDYSGNGVPDGATMGRSSVPELPYGGLLLFGDLPELYGVDCWSLGDSP